MENKVISFLENKKYVDSDDCGEQVKVEVREDGSILIRSTTLSVANRRIELDSGQVKKLIKFIQSKKKRKKVKKR